MPLQVIESGPVWYVCWWSKLSALHCEAIDNHDTEYYDVIFLTIVYLMHFITILSIFVWYPYLLLADQLDGKLGISSVALVYVILLSWAFASQELEGFSMDQMLI